MSQTNELPDGFDVLIEQARQGNSTALGELLSKYRKYLILLARSQLHHHLQAKADPSDLAQEVCLAAYDGIADFKGKSTEEFAAWLRGILSNVIAMQVRRRRPEATEGERVENEWRTSGEVLGSALAGEPLR